MEKLKMLANNVNNQKIRINNSYQSNAHDQSGNTTFHQPSHLHQDHNF